MPKLKFFFMFSDNGGPYKIKLERMLNSRYSDEK